MTEKRALFIIAPEDFNGSELLETRAVLEEAGVEVVVASTKAGECTGMKGTLVRSQASVDQVDTDDFDVVIVVGGSGSRRHLWENQDVHEVIRSFHQDGKIVAAIGRGRHVLDNVGLFPGKSFAWGPAVEIDGNVIAARPPSTTPGWSSKDFGGIIARHLARIG